jgi:hypothetical protein
VKPKVGNGPARSEETEAGSAGIIMS